MVTESFALVRSGEKIAYFTIYRNGTDGVNIMYGSELETFRTINDVNIKNLIKKHNLKYKSLKLIVNQNVSGMINTNIKKSLINKEISVIVEEEKIIFKNDEFEIDSTQAWFREIYFYFLNDSCVIDYKKWEAERIYRYGY